MPQTALPVKIISPRLQHQGDVAQPERSHRAVTQQVQAEEVQMILFAQDPHLQVVEPHEMRARENIIDPPVAELAEAKMQIDIARLALQTGESGPGRPVLLR